MDADVLIVGLGPTGAVLAGLLAQAGVRVLAVEQEAEPYPLPRAAHFDGETMQTFARLGAHEAAARQSRPVQGYRFEDASGEALMQFETRRPAGSRFEAGYMFHQPALEAALRERLAALPGLDIRLSTAMKTIAANTPGGVTAVIEGPAGEQTVSARFLVACDGAASPVRAQLGGGLFDYGFDEPWLVIDCEAADEEGLPQYGLQVCDPARPTTVMPMSPLRRRWEFMLLPGETREEMLAEGAAERLLEPWGRPGQLKVVRRAVYRFHGLVAEQWRKESVLLAGDAAHQMPPFLGQGMCSGIRDAANLAWKLELILQGRASPALLDTYQSEREPHVRAIIETAIAMGQVVCTLDPAVAAARDQAMKAGAPPPPLAMPDPGPGLFHETGGAYAPLLAEAMPEGGFHLISLDASPAAPPGVTARRVGAAVPEGQWLAGKGARAALLRPDGYLFGLGDPGGLLSALADTLRQRQAA